MRRVSILLLLAAALAAHGACFAQSQARDRGDALGATQDTAAQDTADAVPRSPFGKVMAVMISALQRQEGQQSQPVAPVRTTASGTPLGIEVGAAFRGALESRGNAGRNATGTGGAAAAAMPRATPPEDLVVRQATLAGPG
jgi:hypothetical protein